MFSPFRIESAALTHQGRVREQNQDGFCIRERDGLWAVADGMGGHEGGEWASARLVEELDGIEMPAGLDAAGDRVAEAIGAANAAIAAEGEARGSRMGTTIVALLVRGQSYLRALGRRQPRLSAARRRLHPAQPRPYPGPGDGRPRADGAR